MGKAIQIPGSCIYYGLLKLLSFAFRNPVPWKHHLYLCGCCKPCTSRQSHVQHNTNENLPSDPNEGLSANPYENHFGMIIVNCVFRKRTYCYFYRIRDVIYRKEEFWACPSCWDETHLKVLHSALNAPIATKVICFSRLLKCLRSLCAKQCGPRSDCS